MNVNLPKSFMVAQLGARMHYAVPRIFYRDGRLARLFTDLCASKGVLKCLNVLPRHLRPNSVTRMLNRAPKDVPSNLIRARTKLGVSYARRFAKTSTERERIALFLEVGREFCSWVASQHWGEASGVFVYNTAGLEILEVARRSGKATILEQTIAPFQIERSLLAEERQRYPRWEREDGDCTEYVEYAERERREWALADRIVCGSEFVKTSLMECGVAAERCDVVPYGVDAEFALPVRSSGPGPIHVLIVGQVGLRKGAPYAIAAAKQLRGVATIRWVGAFKMAPEAREDFGPDIEFVGPVPRSEMIRHYEWADLFLLPSLCEGSATATYEALMARLPIVCTPNTGSVIHDGREGFIVPTRDVDSIVNRIVRLAKESDLRRSMAEAAGQRAKDVSFESYSRQLLATLNRMQNVG